MTSYEERFPSPKKEKTNHETYDDYSGCAGDVPHRGRHPRARPAWWRRRREGPRRASEHTRLRPLEGQFRYPRRLEQYQLRAEDAQRVAEAKHQAGLQDSRSDGHGRPAGLLGL